MKILTVGQTASMLGVSPSTVRRMQEDGRLQPIRVEDNGTRYYSEADVLPLIKKGRKICAIGYCRIDERDNIGLLEEQRLIIQEYMFQHDCKGDIYSDVGSSLSNERKDFQKVVDKMLKGEVDKIIVTGQDRLTRFGYGLLTKIAKHRGIEIVALHQGATAPPEELKQELLAIIDRFIVNARGTATEREKQIVKKSAEPLIENIYKLSLGLEVGKKM